MSPISSGMALLLRDILPDRIRCKGAGLCLWARTAFKCFLENEIEITEILRIATDVRKLQMIVWVKRWRFNIGGLKMNGKKGNQLRKTQS